VPGAGVTSRRERRDRAGEEPAKPVPGSAPDARWQTEHRAESAPQSAALLLADVHRSLDALDARLDALGDRLSLASLCNSACIAGVHSAKIERGHVACRCVTESLGRHPVEGP
jgi:hypothetical protein